MGLVAVDDPKIAYEVARAKCKQCGPVGFNWIHSPLLDINVNPDNPEINTRAYSDNVDVVTEYAIQECKGFKDGGIIATGKHFPGVGDTASGAHFEVQQVNVDKDTMLKRDLLPYRELIKLNLLPSIMLAHSIFPAFDEKDLATLSKPIITGLLREQMGFEGVVTTDSMTMYSIASRYGGIPNGCAMALAAGADLVLMKAENQLVPETFNAIKKYVEEGKISEKDLDDKVYRILSMKHAYGLFKNGKVSSADPDEAAKDKKIAALAQKVAQRSTIVARDRKKILPLPKDGKTLVIEQMLTTANDVYWHPSLLFKKCLQRNKNTRLLEIGFKPDEADKAAVKRLTEEFDTIIVTNYFKNGTSNAAMVKEIAANKNKKVVVLADTPYKLSIPDEIDTCVVIFGPSPSTLEAAVGVIFGEIKAEGKWPVEYKINP